MSLLVHNSITGLPYHMLIDGDLVKWTSDESQAQLVLGIHGLENSAEPLLSLFDVEVSRLVEEPFRRSLKECGHTGPVPWSQVVPKKMYKEALTSFVSSLQGGMKLLSVSEYVKFFCSSNKLFHLLQPASIDERLCKEILREEDSHVLKAMLSMSAHGSMPVPSYDRVSTKTGRLVIKGGPQILTLKKEHRRVLKPAARGSKLYEIDFTSLEPRVALNIAGKNSENDVYTSFAKSSNLGVSRDVAKLAVLCALYGAGSHRLESVLRKDGSKVKAHELLGAVKNYFQINILSNALRSEAEQGKIHNCFGRPIVVDDTRNTTLINNFLQSSATDIAILGFLEFCEKFQKDVRALFIIHDALIFEMDPKHLSAVTKYVNNGFDLKNMGNFPLKISEFG